MEMSLAILNPRGLGNHTFGLVGLLNDYLTSDEY